MRIRDLMPLGAVALAGTAMMAGRGTRPPPAGTIGGKVTYTGTPPKMKPIDMAKEPFCARLHAAAPVLTENAVTGPGNALRWVLVYVSAGDQGSAPATQPVRLDQKGCQYIPHVLVLQPDQPLDIYNDDSTSHNIHPLARVNPEWNKSQPIGAPPIHAKWEKPEFIPVKCNVHPWMHGWQLALAVFAWRYGDRHDGRPVKAFPGGATPMVVFAAVLVGAEILALTLVGAKVWAGIFQTPPDPNSLQIDVQAEQFAFYFRYPGPDGRFGATHPELINEANENYFGLDPARDTTARDDIVVPTLTIPVNRPIALTLRAKDVNHAFYVPELRIQQDFVPGLAIPLHFTATQTGKHEIVCTQLCGLGHYNMRAYIEVVSEAQFAQWLKDKAAQQ